MFVNDKPDTSTSNKYILLGIGRGGIVHTIGLITEDAGNDVCLCVPTVHMGL